jgi:GT2 family glycosyltransferase
MSAPMLAVQIVTWNSAAVIDACLAALAAQTSRAFEVIVVDNASADGCAERVEAWRDRLPALTVVRERENRGFCGGMNRAAVASTAPWVLFLNPDAELPADFVATALDVVETLPRTTGAIAPCILLPDGRLDSTGLSMDRFRRAYDRDGGAPADRRLLASPEVLGCTGAVALLRRAMLDDVAVDGQVLDEQIFAYYDDLDLAWRAALRGWACRYEARLTATHHRMGRNAIRGLANRPTRLRDQLLSVRNRLLVMARCDRSGDFVRALPWLLPFEVARVAYLALKAPRVLRAYVEAAQALPGAFGARGRIHGRVVSPALPPLPWKVR